MPGTPRYIPIQTKVFTIKTGAGIGKGGGMVANDAVKTPRNKQNSEKMPEIDRDEGGLIGICSPIFVC